MCVCLLCMCVCLLYCVSFNEEFSTCVFEELLFPLHFVSLKSAQISPFFLSPLLSINYSLFRVLSLTLLLRRDRTLRPSLDTLASELAMDSLSPHFRGDSRRTRP